MVPQEKKKSLTSLTSRDQKVYILPCTAKLIKSLSERKVTFSDVSHAMLARIDDYLVWKCPGSQHRFCEAYKNVHYRERGTNPLLLYIQAWDHSINGDPDGAFNDLRKLSRILDINRKSREIGYIVNSSKIRLPQSLSQKLKREFSSGEVVTPTFSSTHKQKKRKTTVLYWEVVTPTFSSTHKPILIKKNTIQKAPTPSFKQPFATAGTNLSTTPKAPTTPFKQPLASAEPKQPVVQFASSINRNRGFIIETPSRMYQIGSMLSAEPCYWTITITPFVCGFKDIWKQGLDSFSENAHAHPQQPYFLLLSNVNVAPVESYGMPLFDEVNGVSPFKILSPNTRVFCTFKTSQTGTPLFVPPQKVFECWTYLPAPSETEKRQPKTAFKPIDGFPELVVDQGTSKIINTIEDSLS